MSPPSDSDNDGGSDHDSTPSPRDDHVPDVADDVMDEDRLAALLAETLTELGLEERGTNILAEGKTIGTMRLLSHWG